MRGKSPSSSSQFWALKRKLVLYSMPSEGEMRREPEEGGLFTATVMEAKTLSVSDKVPVSWKE